MNRVVIKIMLLLLILAPLPFVSCVKSNQGQNSHYQSFGPVNLNIGAGSGDFNISSLKQDDRVEFNFKVSGAPVKCSVQNPKGTTVFISRGGYRYLQRGGGHFIALTSGDYKLHFVSSGLGTSSVITINYRVYQSQ